MEELKKIGSEIKNWKKYLVDGKGPSPSSAEYLLAGTTQKSPEGSIDSSDKEDSGEAAERQSLSSTDSAAEEPSVQKKDKGPEHMLLASADSAAKSEGKDSLQDYDESFDEWYKKCQKTIDEIVGKNAKKGVSRET